MGLKKEKVRLTLHPWHSGLSNISGRGGAKKIVVDCLDFSLFDKILKINQGCLFVIKCDTEGLEPIVIRNLRKSKISKYISTLIIEITPEWLSPKDQKLMTYDLSAIGFKSMLIKDVINSNKQKDLIFKKNVFFNQIINK